MGHPRYPLLGSCGLDSLDVVSQVSAFDPFFGLLFQFIAALQFDLAQAFLFGPALTLKFPLLVLFFSFDTSRTLLSPVKDGPT